MSALTKADLVEHLHNVLGLNKREAKDLIESFFGEMSQALLTGKHVKISGFGNFELREKNARPGRNPKTGEEVQISARRVVTFKPSQKLKKLVESYNGEEPRDHHEEQEEF
jgi:integration host factor subunit alpha